MAKGKLLAEGTYQYLTDGKPTGHETWQISQLGHGGIVVAARGEFEAAPSFSRTYDYELDRGWSPVGLTLRREQDGARTAATQGVEGKNWAGRTQGPGDATAEFQLPFFNQHQLDFESPLFKSVILLRLRLPVSQSREFDAIVLDSNSLVPSGDHQQYKNELEEEVTVPAGTFPAFKYEIASSNNQGATRRIAADRHGIVLVFQSAGQEIQLTRYRRLDTR